MKQNINATEEMDIINVTDFIPITHSNDMTTESLIEQTETNVSWNKVIYSSREEQVFSVLFVGSTFSFTVVAQLLVLVTIIKSPSLHNVHFYTIGAYCFLELVCITIAAPNYIHQFVAGEIPLAACRSLTTIACCIVLGSTYHTGLIAFERYMYFCHPYKYSEYLSTPRVVVAMVVCYLITSIMCLTTELVIGRAYRSSILACNLPDSAIQSLIQFMVVLLPAAVITIFSVRKVWQLTKSAQVAPHQSKAPGEAGSATPVKQALKALRMVLLLSGTLWGTMIPGYIVRIVVLNSGSTWDDLDTRRHMGPFIAMRVATFIYTSVSSFVNPIIYYYSRKDLREATWKLLRRNIVEPIATSSSSHPTS